MARGRMISKSLSTSEKFAALHKTAGPLAEFCQVLFMLMVSHAEDHGRLPGDEFTIKHLICPTSPRRETGIRSALLALHKVGLITWYQVGGHKFVQINGFGDHQQLHGHEKRASFYPGPDEQSAQICPDPPKVAPTVTVTVTGTVTGTVDEPSPRKPAPDSRVKVFLDWFHDEYAQRRDGAKYVVNGGKDGKLVKDLLQTHDLERLKKHATILLTSNEEWIETTDRGIGILAAKINWLEDRLVAWEKKHRG